MSNFPYNWLAPGEIRYCSCGYRLLPEDVQICAHCRYKDRLEDMNCDLCDRPCAVSSIKGNRCDTHAETLWMKKADWPSYTWTGYKRIPKPYVDIDVEKRKSQEVHERLWKEACELAERRRSFGMPELFWIKK